MSWCREIKKEIIIISDLFFDAKTLKKKRISKLCKKKISWKLFPTIIRLLCYFINFKIFDSFKWNFIFDNNNYMIVINKKYNKEKWKTYLCFYFLILNLSPVNLICWIRLMYIYIYNVDFQCYAQCITNTIPYEIIVTKDFFNYIKSLTLLYFTIFYITFLQLESSNRKSRLKRRHHAAGTK